MIFVYNFLQITLLVITLPVLVLIILCKKKYRGRMAQRLGFGLPELLRDHPAAGKKVIWLHALSVGEVTSALPLVRGIQKEMKNVSIVFSASTSTGRQIAKKLITPYVVQVISAPVDLLCTVDRFIDCIQPDLFILIETDFWPNWLNRLHQRKIPLMLANGRISKQSFKTYQRFRFFFSPLFRTFSLLSVQTEQDARQMIRIGVPRSHIATLGNLKYDTSLTDNTSYRSLRRKNLGLAENSIIWVCGSTHRGEEEIILKVFGQVKKEHENLVLIIAPRDPDRGGEIFELAAATGHPVSRRTSRAIPSPSILILDTIGELTQCYELAKIAFIGGSLVPCGGHNPLEAAAKGVPVIFGPYMDDFQEISRDCLRYAAGKEVQSSDDLSRTINTLLSDESEYSGMSKAARRMIHDKSGVVSRHLKAISRLLAALEPVMNG